MPNQKANLYDAFISYSHAVDKKLAPELQSSLHKLAKPWHKRRILNVFRDQTDLSATPHLWKNIESALGNSKYFVLMASPEAAASKWVGKEIEIWLVNKSKENILIALTEGEIIWDEKKGDFDWEKTNALSPALKGVFEMEPLFVDFRGFRARENLSVQNPEFKDKVAHLAATLHGRTVGDMIGEEVKQHKKTIRIRNTAIFFLVFLLILTISGMVYALYQQKRAIRQSKIALSRQLAAQSLNVMDEQFDLSLLLSAEAFSTFNTLEARSSLLTGLEYPNPAIAFLHGHQTPVIELTFSPDGKTLASGSWDRNIILWDVEKRRMIGQPLIGHEFLVEGGSVFSFAFSPDGKTLASGSGDYIIILWDVATGESIGQPLKGHNNNVYSLAFSPDGKTLASGSYDTIILWDVEKRQMKSQPLIGHKGTVEDLAFSPDGKTLASGGDDEIVILWDVEKSQMIGRPLKGHSSIIFCVAFNPDGKTLASGSGDNTVILWDVANRPVISQPLKGHKDLIDDVAFSVDGKTLVSRSDDNTIILWDVKKHTMIGQPLKGQEGFFNCAALSPDGKTLALGSGDNTINLWDVPTRHKVGQPFKELKSSVNSIVFSPDGKTLASGNDDSTVILWDVEKRQMIGQPFEGHQDIVNSVAFSPDGEILASGSGDNTTILWDVATGKLVSQLPKGTERPTPNGNYAKVNSVAFSPDGKTLASGGIMDMWVGAVFLWDVEKSQLIGQPLKGKKNECVIEDVAFSPDGKSLVSTGGWDRNISLWDVANGNRIGQFTGHEGVVVEEHNDVMHSVAFSPDGKTLATGSDDNTIILWNVEKRKMIGLPLRGHANVVEDVVFSPDSKTLASGSEDSTIILWDVSTRQMIGQPLKCHHGPVSSVAFSPDGKILASGSKDKTIFLWDVDIESWKARARRIANRDLTKPERDRYIGF